MKKTLAILMAFVLVIAMSVAGTLAYLTAQDQVVNTFTVGTMLADGGLTLNESSLVRNEDGTYCLDKNTPVKKNENYVIIPGLDLPKDPYVDVTFKGENPEKAYLFIEVNSTLPRELTYSLTADWTATTLKGVNGGTVYKYNNGTAFNTNLVKVPVLKDDVITVPAGYTPVENGAYNMTFTAYMCQSAGFADAEAAWNGSFAA